MTTSEVEKSCFENLGIQGRNYQGFPWMKGIELGLILIIIKLGLLVEGGNMNNVESFI